MWTTEQWMCAREIMDHSKSGFGECPVKNIVMCRVDRSVWEMDLRYVVVSYSTNLACLLHCMEIDMRKPKMTVLCSLHYKQKSLLMLLFFTSTITHGLRKWKTWRTSMSKKEVDAIKWPARLTPLPPYKISLLYCSLPSRGQAVIRRR